MDITDGKAVQRILDKVKPDTVIHTAAETDVDKCENNKNYALRINAEGTKILASACSRVDARIIYVSTDYVFDGEKGLYTEVDEPNPINQYGLTKLMGERYVMELCERSVTLRTSVLYGVHPEKSNFATWVIAALQERKLLTIVEDHFNSPTFAGNLAEVILEIVSNGLKGIYHTAGSERISRYEFALEIAEIFSFDVNLIRSIKMKELKAWKAKRPKDSSLCVDRAKKEIEIELLGVTQGLREMKKNWMKTK